jgi:hypothetical protein
MSSPPSDAQDLAPCMGQFRAETGRIDDGTHRLLVAPSALDEIITVRRRDWSGAALGPAREAVFAAPA